MFTVYHLLSSFCSMSCLALRLRQYTPPNTAHSLQKHCTNSPLPYTGHKNALFP